MPYLHHQHCPLHHQHFRHCCYYVQVNSGYKASGQTPLHIAASDVSINAIASLIAAGARLEVDILSFFHHQFFFFFQEPDCMRQTALHYSLATSRSTEATEALLRWGEPKDTWTYRPKLVCIQKK